MTVLGIDIGATSCRAVAAGDGRSVRVLAEARTPDDPAELQAVLRRFRARVARRPGAAGIAFAAAVGSNGTVTRWPNRRRYEGFDVSGAACSALDVEPIWLDDCAAAALAEHTAVAGRAAGSTRTLYVGVGSGIGAGFVDCGRLVTEAADSTGLGHVRVASAGRIACRCGARGCVQAVASGRVLTERAAAIGLRTTAVAAAAAAGDARARALVRAMVQPLAEALGLASARFAPDRIVLGGGVCDADPWLPAELAKHVRVPVVRARLGRLNGALGALAYARGATR
jgi:predicted NBD/HSP70 family sugar kinase